jgi:hypothetical protein
MRDNVAFARCSEFGVRELVLIYRTDGQTRSRLVPSYPIAVFYT